MRDQSSHTGADVEEATDRPAVDDDDADVVPTGPTAGDTMVTPASATAFVDGEHASLSLRSDPASVRLARRFVDQWLGAVAGTAFAEDLQLVASELVTNAVRHSSLIGIRLTRSGSCVRLEVDDQGGGEPMIAEHVSLTAPSGRGLKIVDQLATEWGWRPLSGGGKRVWCQLCPPAT